MRIAFVGKGGSGKTTLSALTALSLAKKNRTIALDIDINQHLTEVIDPSLAKPPSLTANAQEIKKFLLGSNKLVGDISQMYKSTPPGRGSQLFKFSNVKDAPFDQLFVAAGRNLYLSGVGEMTEEDRGYLVFMANRVSLSCF